MQNELMEVEIEVVILGLERGHFNHAAYYNGELINVDLFTADAIDINVDDIHGEVKLNGFWDGEDFVAESCQLIH